MILLDTNVLIEILEKESRIGAKVYSSLVASKEAIGTTSINLHELLYGLRKYAKSVRQLARIPIVEFNKRDAELSSQIELDMERAGMAVRRTDAMIAAIAINHSMKLLTLDTRHFEPMSRKTPLKLFS